MNPDHDLNITSVSPTVYTVAYIHIHVCSLHMYAPRCNACSIKLWTLMCMYTSQHAQAHVRICVHSLVYITHTAYIARNVHHLLFGSRDQHGFTPMHHAAINGHGSVIDVFISRGARLDIVNMGGDTLLHVAAAHGKYDIVQKVLYVHTCVHACVHGVKYDCVLCSLVHIYSARY